MNKIQVTIISIVLILAIILGIFAPPIWFNALSELNATHQDAMNAR